MAEMPAVETLNMAFKFQDKENVFLNHCRTLWDNMENFDVIFVMSNNIELKAHRLILAISCEFFKDLFEACFLESEDLIKISLPHYSADCMALLLKFFYTGETYIPPVILQEFLDCCLEFNADNIIDIDTLVKQYKIDIEEPTTIEDHQLTEWFNQQQNNPKLLVSRVEIFKEEMDIEDYFSYDLGLGNNVEAIYLDENDDHQEESESRFPKTEEATVEENDEFQNMEETTETDGVTEILEELEQAIQTKKEESELEEGASELEEVEGEESNEESKVERVAYRCADGDTPNPLYDEQLKKACEDVIENGISFLTASRKYGITRSVVHRHVQRIRQTRNILPPRSFPTPGTSNPRSLVPEVSWWEASNPSWNNFEEQEARHKKSKSKIKYKVDGLKGRNPEFVENLRKAVEDVLQNGVSFWTAHKKYGITRSVIHRHVQRIRQENSARSRSHKKIKTPKKPKEIKEIKEESVVPHLPRPILITAPQPVNILQLREEVTKYKERLQKAINACRDGSSSVKRSSKTYDVPADAIERNLQGFKR